MTARLSHRPRPVCLALAATALLLSACSGGDSDKKTDSEEPIAPTPASSTEPKPGKAGSVDFSEPREFTHAYVYASALYTGLGQILFDTGSYPAELTDETLAAANAPRATNMTIAQYERTAEGGEGDASHFTVCVVADSGSDFALLDSKRAVDVLVGKGDSCDADEAVPYAESWLAEEAAAEAAQSAPSTAPSSKPTSKPEQPATPEALMPTSPEQQAKFEAAAKKAVEVFLKTLQDNAEFAETPEGNFGYMSPPKSADDLPLPSGVARLAYYELVESPSGSRNRAEFCLEMKSGGWGAYADPEKTRAQAASMARPPITVSATGECPKR